MSATTTASVTSTASSPATTPARRQAPLKVDPATDELITAGANFLGMNKKDLVAEAVTFYLDAHRDEMKARMQAMMKELDGSRAARVAMLAGISREQLDAVGGVREKD